jgi:thioredoxin reductase (NADPH)
MSNIASHVTLIHRRDSLRAEKIMQDKLLERERSGKVTMRWNTTVDEILGNDKGVTHVRLNNVASSAKEDLAVEGVFIAIGHNPNTELFRGKLDMENGYIVTRGGREGMATQTNVPGVFAAGDVQDHIYRQAVTSAASGCQAALDAERYLDGVA